MTINVYERLRGDIIAGRLTPGEALGESALGVRYGTSRTPIREALQRLETERLVSRTARGMRVHDTSPEEILDIYEVRISLESLAARAAARRRSELDLARLISAKAAMDACDDEAQRAETNRAFHETVWAASHNPTLIDQLERLSVHLVRYPVSTLAEDGRWQAALAEHDELVSAIEARDEDAAARLGEQHMSRARDARLQLYARLR